MVLQIIIYVAILCLLLALHYNRYRIRYWAALLHERGWNSTVHYDRCQKIFHKLYQDVNGMEHSLRERRELAIADDLTYTYGEVTFFSFVRILEKTEPKTGEIFYDLGSGAGKAVIIAGIVFDFAKAYGIEKLTGMYNLSNSILEKLMALPEIKDLPPTKHINIQFINGDYFVEDFSDADVLYVNTTCFENDMLDVLRDKLLKLKVGARIILGGSKLRDIGGFEVIYENTHLMTWGLSVINIYKRI